MIASIVLVADQLAKWWALARLEPGRCTPDTCIDVVGPLRFHLAFNPGAAFSSFTGGGPVLGALAVVMSVYLVHLARQTTDPIAHAAFAAVAGGAVGNVMDRVRRADDGFLSGEVVDFIDLQFWPIFNVADMAVVGGVAVLMVRLWRTGGRLDGVDAQSVDTPAVDAPAVDRTAGDVTAVDPESTT